MKIRKNGKVINLTESDLRRITKIVMNEGLLTEGQKLSKFVEGRVPEGGKYTLKFGEDGKPMLILHDTLMDLTGVEYGTEDDLQNNTLKTLKMF